MNRFTALLIIGLTAPSLAMAEEGLRVEFVPVETTSLTLDSRLTGTILAKDSIDMGFRLGGRVTSVLAAEGDKVVKGQALARTDPTQQTQGLRVAEAAVSSARAAQAQAKQANDRAKAMLERGVGTRAAADSASQALSASEGALAQAMTSLGQAQRALEDTVLRAPTDAIVTTRSVEPGQIVGAAQTVMSLAAAQGREAVFQTPDSPLLHAAMGASVSITPLDYPDMTMTAHVTEVSPLVDPMTGSVTIHATIDNPPDDINLLGGATHGVVHFPLGSGIAIPWTSLTASHDQPAVWVVEADGRANLRPVMIERFVDGKVILKSGLEAGETVVGAGSQKLYPGRAVVAAEMRK